MHQYVCEAPRLLILLSNLFIKYLATPLKPPSAEEKFFHVVFIGAPSLTVHPYLSWIDELHYCASLPAFSVTLNPLVEEKFLI